MRDKEVLKIFLKNGWREIRQKGSHHVVQKGNDIEVIPVHGKEMSTGIAHKLLKKHGLK